MNKIISALVGLMFVFCVEASDFSFNVRINKPTEPKIVYQRPHIHRDHRTIYVYKKYRTIYVQPERIYYAKTIRPVRRYYCY